MNAVQLAPSLPTPFHAFSYSVANVMGSTLHVVKATAQIAKQQFGLASQPCIGRQARTLKGRKVSLITSAKELIKGLVGQVYDARDRMLNRILYFGAGTLGTMLVVERLGWVTLKESRPSIVQARDTLLVLGSVTALHYYSIQLQQLTQQLRECNDPVEKGRIETEAHNAVLAIVSAASCILATALAVLAAPAALVFILWIVGTITGCLPSVYYFFSWMDGLQHNDTVIIKG